MSLANWNLLIPTYALTKQITCKEVGVFLDLIEEVSNLSFSGVFPPLLIIILICMEGTLMNLSSKGQMSIRISE